MTGMHKPLLWEGGGGDFLRVDKALHRFQLTIHKYNSRLLDILSTLWSGCGLMA